MTREYFTAQVYGKAMRTCAGCHLVGGVAEQQGAKFKMYRETYPDFVSANIDSIRAYSELQIRDTPLILLKSVGERNHGGGPVLAKDSEEYGILSKLVSDLRGGTERLCDAPGELGLQMLTLRETARKAAIVLAGKYPTERELELASTEVGFDAFVVSLTREEPFYDFLREMWNDVLLTERGVDARLGRFYANAPELYEPEAAGYTLENYRWASASITQEPLRFIEYVVRNDLPFSDVVAGNYVVANPYTARLYGLPHEKPLAPSNFIEWKRIDASPVQNTLLANGRWRTKGVPAAGILSTPSFLNRWETTPTNKGRKRARIVFKAFLATDILKLAQRPVDSAALASIQNPTTTLPACTVCHDLIDPVAGAFRGFGEAALTRFSPSDPWHDDMRPPGFDSIDMPAENYVNAVMWLGAQLPTDPRFGVSIAHVMYKGIIGDGPLVLANKTELANDDDRVKAFGRQNDWFTRIASELVGSKYDLRKLVLAIVRSPYFRAKAGDPSSGRNLDGLGQGRLLTPEMLGRKYRATTGLYFFQGDAAKKDAGRSRDGYLRSDLSADKEWRLVYGGIDSGNVAERTDTMSPIMVATTEYMGVLTACRATSYDFTKPQAERRFFRNVETSTVPFVKRANKAAPIVQVLDSEPKIRADIVGLFFRFLGETVSPDSPEVSGVYSLFVDVWRDLEATELEVGSDKRVGSSMCAAGNDWDKGARFELDQKGVERPVFEKLRPRPAEAEYELGMRLDRDETFAIRSWQTVLAYLMIDYRFLHE